MGTLAEQIREATAMVERRCITAAIERCEGNEVQAAELLGISLRSLRGRRRRLLDTSAPPNGEPEA